MWNFEKIPSIISEGRHILVNGKEYIGTATGWKPVVKPVPVKKEEKDIVTEALEKAAQEMVDDAAKIEKKKSTRKKKGDANA